MMATFSLDLNEDAHKLWCKWKHRLGFLSNSVFVEHLLKDYENSAYHEQVPALVNPTLRSKENVTPFSSGLVVGDVMPTDDSDQASSGKNTPVDSDPFEQSQRSEERKDLKFQRKPYKKQRGFVGLETVVRRLHQAKGDPRDVDGMWIRNDRDNSRTSSPDSGHEFRVKLEVESDYDSSESYGFGNDHSPYSHEFRAKLEVESDYDSSESYGFGIDHSPYSQPLSPRILPHTIRTVTSEEFGSSVLENLKKDTIDNQVSLRSLLERPPISSPFRWTMEGSKGKGVAPTACGSLNNQNSSPSYEPSGNVLSHSQDSVLQDRRDIKYSGPHNPHYSMSSPLLNTNSVALDSLVRLAAQVKRDEGLREKELMIWKSMERRGINVSEIQKSFRSNLQVLGNGSHTDVAHHNSTDLSKGPTLKDILQSIPSENAEPKDLPENSFISRSKNTIHLANFDSSKPMASISEALPSATSALQQLAHLKDARRDQQRPTTRLKHNKVKTEGRSSRKMGKSSKNKKHMLRKRSGVKSKKRKRHLSAPTVKALLIEQRSHKSQHAKPFLQRAAHNNSSIGKEDPCSASASQMLLSITSNFMSDHTPSSSSGTHKRGRPRKTYKWHSKGNLEEKKSKRHSKSAGRAYEQMCVEASHTPNVNIAQQHQNGVSSEPIPASQVMRLLAEKGSSSQNDQSDLNVTPTSISSSASEVMKLLASKKYQSPPSTPLKHPLVPEVQSSNFLNGRYNPANLRKGLEEYPCSSFGPGSTIPIPLNLMFMSPPAQDSSRAFSLMKQLITKSST